MPTINWGLLGLQQSRDPGERFTEGFQFGQRRNALQQYARDPYSDRAVGALMEVDPRIGIAALGEQRAAAGQERETVFNKAAGEYLGGGSLAPSGPSGALPGRTQQSAIGASNDPGAGGPSPNMGGALAGQPSQSSVASPGGGQAPALSGRAFTGEGASRGEMLRLMYQNNPELALRLARDDREAQYEFTEQYRDVNRWAIEMLGSVQDQAGWERMIQQADGMYRRLGLNVNELVPAQYPGPDGVRQLLMGAMDADQQLAAQDRRHNIDADNERADMNTENMINNRDARTGIARERLDVSRRGQDMSSADRRRGQDIGSRDRRRGQDAAGSRRTGGRQTGGRQTGRNRPITATGPNGQRLRLNPQTNQWEAAN